MNSGRAVVDKKDLVEIQDDIKNLNNANRCPLSGIACSKCGGIHYTGACFLQSLVDAINSIDISVPGE